MIMASKLNKVIEAIKSRRTIRSYTRKEVPSEYIDIILDAAHWAPSAANRQPWQFIVIRDKAVEKKIQKLVEENRELTISIQKEPFKTGFSKYETSWISKAPVHIVVCADPKKTGPHAGGEETYKYASGAAVQNLMLAAHSLGLGTCWLTMFNKDKLRALLGIPMEIDIIGVITVGYPKYVPDTPETTKRYGGKPRCDLNEIVFYEKYGELKP
jgi:5,6-dimethylbenzimidazole synthase